MTASLPLAAILLFAAAVQGFAGFGFALLAVPLLTLWYDPHAVIPLVTLCGLIVNTILFVKHRRHTRWRIVVPMLAGAAVGIVPGLFFLKNVDASYFRIVLAAVLVGYASYALFLTKPVRTLGRGWGAVAGLLSGILGAGMSTNGPPVIIFCALQPWPKEAIKGTLTGFLFTTGFMVVVAHAIGGVTTAELALLFAFHAPLVIVGTLAGSWLFARSSGRSYERGVYALILLMGFLCYPW
jgi:hypothetical protein